MRERFHEVKGLLHIGSYGVTCLWAAIATDAGTLLGWITFGVVFVLMVGMNLAWTASYGDVKDAKGAFREAKFAHDRWSTFLHSIASDREAA
jgi:hypothetical protein